MTPICKKCKFMTNKVKGFRTCPRIPILHREMFCDNRENMKKDYVSGEYYKPYCEEVNRHGECLSYYPLGLEVPTLNFIIDNELQTVKVIFHGTSPFVFSDDGSELSSKMEVVGEYDEENKEYVFEKQLEHSCVLRVACILDEVLSPVVSRSIEIPDEPEIKFDKTTNTVTINSYNKVRYTTDGTAVDEESPIYEGPFTIDHNTMVNAVSFSNNEPSNEVSKYCVSVEPPVISFNPETNEVSIQADDDILFSTDGSNLYDDSEVYSGPFTIDKNTTVKAACIVDNILSDTVTYDCKVLNAPKITFNPQTQVVTINSENPVLYTTDGSDVKKKDTEYKSPFKITATSTIKAKSIVDGRLSEQAELTCTI